MDESSRSLPGDAEIVGFRTQRSRPRVADAAAGLAATAAAAAEARDARVRQRRYAAGQTIFAEGAAAECLYTVTEGEVRLCKQLPDGRRQITGFLQPGDILGLAARKIYAYGAEAVGIVKLACVPLADLDRVPGFRARLFAATCDELAAAQEQMLLLGRKSARERVLSFLLMRAARGQPDGEVADVVRLDLSRGDIADYLGLTHETVCRVFTGLRADGLVALPSPRHVRFPDLAAVRAIASGE